MAVASNAAAAPVNTRKVKGRRTVHFERVAEILRDAESLAAGGYRRLGNWSLGQICEHLAGAILMGVEGARFNAPWPLRLLVRPFKRRFLTRTMSPGFKAPKTPRANLIPADAVGDEAGLESLRAAVCRWESEPQRQIHPVFGKLTPAEWEQFECRHAELHLSFLLPN